MLRAFFKLLFDPHIGCPMRTLVAFLRLGAKIFYLLYGGRYSTHLKCSRERVEMSHVSHFAIPPTVVQGPFSATVSDECGTLRAKLWLPR